MRSPVLWLVALLAAAGLMLSGVPGRAASRRVVTLAAPVPASAALAGASGGRVAGPVAGPAVAPGGAAPVQAQAATVSAAVVPYYGSVSARTRVGRRYMAVVADPTAGIGPLASGWTAQSHTVVVAGLTRVYLTVAPATLSGSVPVVVLMHGVNQTAAEIVDMTQLAEQTGPAIIVAPQGWEQSWNAGGCCGAAAQSGIDDVDFIRTAVQQVLAANPAANASRVYAVGFSNGGRMAYRLACELPGTFTGFAAAEAVPMQNCSALHPLSIMIIAQQADPLITVAAGAPPKWTEGRPEPTVAAIVAQERAMDGCAGSPTINYTGVAERSIWACAAGTRFTYVWYPGGAHSWRAPTGATPGTSDMVLSLMGGQLVTGRSISSGQVRPAPAAPMATTVRAQAPAPAAPAGSMVHASPAPVPPAPPTQVAVAPAPAPVTPAPVAVSAGGAPVASDPATVTAGQAPGGSSTGGAPSSDPASQIPSPSGPAGTTGSPSK